jgi:nucleoside-triphosphatase
MLVIVTGPSGSGKTMLCRRILALARRRGLDCAGILSPARFRAGHKVGIDLLDVRTGQVRRLAEADDEPGPVRTATYRFHADALAWGVAVLHTATPCDLLLVDELGPLELIRGEGWVGALEVLRSGRFRGAVVVVRPSLLGIFQAAVPAADARIVTLPAARSEEIAVEILARFVA